MEFVEISQAAPANRKDSRHGNSGIELNVTPKGMMTWLDLSDTNPLADQGPRSGASRGRKRIQSKSLVSGAERGCQTPVAEL